MSLRDVSFQISYNPDNCPDIIGRLYEPALAESVRYDRTTYGFSPTGLMDAATGVAGTDPERGPHTTDLRPNPRQRAQ